MTGRRQQAASCSRHQAQPIISSPFDMTGSRQHAASCSRHQAQPIALCVRLNRKWELGILTKTSTSPLIFLKLNYFRHNYLEIVLCSVSLLMHIWVQVEHGLLYRQVYTWISCNSSRLHAGCVWTYGDELNGALKKLILNIFDDLVSEIFGKYLHISDSIFTMFLAPEKKVILGCFFQLEVICLCAKFQVSLASGTRFLPKYVTFLTNMW